MSDASIVELLRRFEVALAERDPEGIDGGLSTLIADDFIEFGRSGRVWTAATIRPLLESDRGDPVEIEGFRADVLADGVILATYRAVGANRSSIWVHREGRWQIRFHQGTATAGPVEDP